MSECKPRTKIMLNNASTVLDIGTLANLRIRRDGQHHEPEEPYDREPQTLHDTLHLCVLPWPVSQADMGHHRCQHERSSERRGDRNCR